MARRSRVTGTTIVAHSSRPSATDSKIARPDDSIATAPQLEAGSLGSKQKIEKHLGGAAAKDEPLGLAKAVRKLDAMLVAVAGLAADIANLDVVDHGEPTLPDVHALAVIIRGAVDARSRHDIPWLEALATEVSPYLKRREGESEMGIELRAKARGSFAEQLVFGMRSLLEQDRPGKANPTPPGWLWRKGKREAAATC